MKVEEFRLDRGSLMKTQKKQDIISYSLRMHSDLQDGYVNQIISDIEKVTGEGNK